MRSVPPSRIRVMFDEQIFLLQDHGGISRYFTELIKAFNSNPSLGIEPTLSSYSVRNKHLQTEVNFLPLKPIKFQVFALWQLFKQALFNRKISDSVDLVHLTFYLPGFFNRFKGIPKVVTLHDMIPEMTKTKMQIWNPHFLKRSHINRASIVLSVSDNSTREMIAEYGYESEVVTTYLGVGPEYHPNLANLDWHPERYLLFVGNRSGYKDFHVALEAFAGVSSMYPDLRLVLVGGGGINNSEKKRMVELGISSKIIQKTVTPEELPNVYSNALALIYTSRNEGFGLPLLESMASGTPILASSTPINKEIAGECASYFPPGDSLFLSGLMSKVYTDSPSFQGKIASGLVRSRNFTWERCAERTALEYRRLIEGQ